MTTKQLSKSIKAKYRFIQQKRKKNVVFLFIIFAKNIYFFCEY